MRLVRFRETTGMWQYISFSSITCMTEADKVAKELSKNFAIKEVQIFELVDIIKE